MPSWSFLLLALASIGCPQPPGEDGTGASSTTSSETAAPSTSASSSVTDTGVTSTSAETGMDADSSTVTTDATTSTATTVATDATETTTGSGEACDDPEPILQPGGTPTGFGLCEDGRVVRVGPSTCEDPGPPGSCGRPLPERGCATDADCDAGPHGRCDDVHGPVPGLGCGCSYGCTTDADCPAGFDCACSGPGIFEGRSLCIPQTCDSATDCGDSEQCVLGWMDGSCSAGYRVDCTTPGDTCTSDADCGPGTDCYPEAGTWMCLYEGCK